MRPPAAAARVDVTLTFHTSYDALAKRLPMLFERTTTAGMVWVCWPKKSAQKSPGTRRHRPATSTRTWSATSASSSGFVDVKVAAIDETWSGLKFVRRLADR